MLFNDLDDGIGCIFSKFVDDTNMGGVVDTLESRADPKRVWDPGQISLYGVTLTVHGAMEPPQRQGMAVP